MARKMFASSVKEQEPEARAWSPKIEDWGGIKTILKVESLAGSVKGSLPIPAARFYLNCINSSNKSLLKTKINY